MQLRTLWLDSHARGLIEHEAARRWRRETGGALFGYAENSHIVVACAYGPGPRAKHRRTSFEPHPTTTGLLMDAVRSSSHARYRYLGSWHTHPGGAAWPSSTDVATAAQIAREPEVLLPTPLMLIQATELHGRAAHLRELRAWQWNPDIAWVMPLQIELIELSHRYCPVVHLPCGRRGRTHVLTSDV